jgi:hypothetical protein
MTIANSLVLTGSDNAFGTIGVGLTTSGTSLTFTTGHGARFPAVAAGQVLYACLLNATNVLEEIKITAHTAGADTATIVRGVNGTSGLAWNAGDRIECRVSSEVLHRLQQEALAETIITTGDGGATYTGTVVPTLLGYIQGVVYALTLSGTTSNSGATPTIALNGLSAITVVVNGQAALAIGQMPIAGLYKYDGTYLVLINPLSGFAASSDMIAGTSTVLAVSPGEQRYHPAHPKAWCVFSGTATGTNAPLAGYGIASVVRSSAGDYTLNFSTALTSTNYAATVGGAPVSNGTVVCIPGEKNGGTRSTAAYEVFMNQSGGAGGGQVDGGMISVAIFTTGTP